jgi:integrase
VPRGSAVIRYEGRRAVVWRIKFSDADGKQVMETLGSEREGWTERKAKAELRHRLTDVERERLRKPEKVTLASFARQWLDTYPDQKGLKRSTREGYKTIVEKHLIPAVGHNRLDTIDVDRLERYIADKRRSGLQPRTVNRHLNLLNEILAAALRRQLIRMNPVSAVERPREPRRRWRILTPAEVAVVQKAFLELAAEAENEERAWREQARVIFLTVVGAGLRRGEIFGLRWRDLSLADPDGPTLRVEQTWVRSGFDTPKSDAGGRTIALGPILADELFQHRARSGYAGEDELVFCSPTKGTPLDPARYGATFKLVLAKAKITDYVRPFHDGRHTAITNDAASGNAPLAIMKRAGHAAFSTTQVYIDLSGEMFREEAERLERRLLGTSQAGLERSSDRSPS